MTTDEIRALLNNLESDRVERTISITNTDKFFASKATVVEHGQAIANGFLTEEDLQKGSDLTENNQKQPNLSTFDEKQPQKQPNLSISDFPTMVTWNVYQAIKLNRKAKYSWLADNLGVSECTIQRAIDDLKKLKYIDPEHSKVKGEWLLLK